LAIYFNLAIKAIELTAASLRFIIIEELYTIYIYSDYQRRQGLN